MILVTLGAPLSAALAAFAPQLWAIGAAWALGLVLLIVLDGSVAARLLSADINVPKVGEVGTQVALEVDAFFSKNIRPRNLSASVELDGRLENKGKADISLQAMSEVGHFGGQTQLHPNRRGQGDVGKLWVRWMGPLGLAWRQSTRANEQVVSITPNIAAVRSPTVQMFLRDSIFGLLARKFRGEGSEFEALAEYQPGMDRRSIDWKGSARHSKLLAKEYDTERNNQIVFALDSGASMCEPVDGLPRIDRAVSAALLTSYVTMKAGDRVSLFSFAAKPEVSTPFLAGSQNFFRLQQAAAEIDYRHQESNFTLALSTLATSLKRRSLIVIFTDFTDPTSAEHMLEAAARLTSRHLVLFVVLDDEELLALTQAEPEDTDQVTQSVTAAALLNQKKLVVTRLKHMGIDVIESRHKDMGTRLINSYLKIKRRGSL